MSLATTYARALLGTAAIAIAAPAFGQDAEVTTADASTPAPDAGQLVAVLRHFAGTGAPKRAFSSAMASIEAAWRAATMRGSSP